MRNTDLRAVAIEKATAIVEKMPHWAMDVQEHEGHASVQAVNRDAPAQRIAFSYRDGRLHIKGLFPEYRDGRRYYIPQGEAKRRDWRLAISVNPDRDPVALRRDIAKRLLISYREALKMAQAEIEKEERYEAELLALQTRMAGLFGEAIDQGWPVANYGSLDVHGIAVEVRTNRAVHVELHVEGNPDEIAEKVEALRAVLKPKPREAA